jgi:group I intron endonuclease
MIIYKSTCLINNKIYIGKTKYELSKRIKQHINKSNKGSNLLFHKAIKKYGIKNFKWEILKEFKNIDELNKFEIEIIEELNSTNSKLGYNIALGGNGGNTITNNPRKKELSENVSKFHKNKKLTQEHKDKISKGNKNVSRNNSHLHTKTIIEKRTITRLKNKKTWTLSQESKDKISKGNKNKSKPPRTKEHLDKLAESNRTIDKSAKIRGKTWEEIYGIERANELRELRRIKALNRKNGTGIN